MLCPRLRISFHPHTKPSCKSQKSRVASASAAKMSSFKANSIHWAFDEALKVTAKCSFFFTVVAEQASLPMGSIVGFMYDGSKRLLHTDLQIGILVGTLWVSRGYMTEGDKCTQYFVCSEKAIGVPAIAPAGGSCDNCSSL